MNDTRKSRGPERGRVPSSGPERGRVPWIIRTYAGFGDAEQSNRRFRENLAHGQRGLSVAFDLPTQNGYDADHAMAAGEVGGTGVSVSHVGDMDVLFRDIDVGTINTSMTINATAPWLYALYVALADQRGVPRAGLRGTTQNDILKEFVARGTSIFDPEHSLRLTTDLITFAATETPQWNPINSCGYHYMESGASPAEEVGFAIGNALLILDAIRPALPDEAFRQVVDRISFFINSGIELVPEIAKVRAYAQLWTELCTARYGAAARFRAGCQVRSLTLTAQQPEVNLLRIAYEALPVVLSASARVGALQLPGFREALALPDETEQLLALRTQQVLMYETGIADWDDIFEGSIVIGRVTDETKAEARDIVARMAELGYAASIPWIATRLTAGLVRWRQQIESGERTLVGVNAFVGEIGLAREGAARVQDAVPPERVAARCRDLAAWRAQRDAATAERARRDLQTAARRGDNVLPASIALAKAGGTTGEWTAALEEVFGGRYQAPLGADLGDFATTLAIPKAPRPVRVLLAKSGLDGHVNAVKLLAFACRRAGMEVVYTGLKQTPEMIVAAALQEDVDLIGVSSLSGSHLWIAGEVHRHLTQAGRDIPVVIGGIIPEADVPALRRLGVRHVFTPRDGEVGRIVATMIDAARARDAEH
jgi:(2R)-ethylmalonyl-CoA mutase